MTTKGYASECLILAGAYCSSFNLALGIVLLCLGVLGAVGKFGVGVNASAKKDQLYDALANLVTKIVEKPIVPDFSAFRGNDEVH